MDRRKFIRRSATQVAGGLAAGSLLAAQACQTENTETAQNGDAATDAAASAAAGATAGAATNAPNINLNRTFKWKMVTTWPPNFPVLGEGCLMVANWLRRMSGGRLDITVYGAGELVPALEVFEAVSSGAVEMGNGVAYYWAGKMPAAQFFASVPFGMNAQQMSAWVLNGGGMPLWQDLYKPFNLLPMLCGNTGVQMGGWFNRTIDSIDSVSGLKMRMPGLGGKVLTQAGGTAVLSPGGEIYTNLERGVIDATEWIGPYHDHKMGFYKVAPYYYYPGWHEPGTAFEMVCNLEKFNSLPTDLQEMVHTAVHRLNSWTLAAFDQKNTIYLQKLVKEEGTQLKRFPAEVLQRFKEITTQVLADISAKDATSRKVYTAYKNFHEAVNGWSDVTERVYFEALAQRKMA